MSDEFEKWWDAIDFESYETGKDVAGHAFYAGRRSAIQLNEEEWEELDRWHGVYTKETTVRKLMTQSLKLREEQGE